MVINTHDLSKSEIILLSNDSEIFKFFDKSTIFIKSLLFSAIYIVAFKAYHHFFDILSIVFN
jgi:hypothetical protein